MGSDVVVEAIMGAAVVVVEAGKTLAVEVVGAGDTLVGGRTETMIAGIDMVLDVGEELLGRLT